MNIMLDSYMQQYQQLLQRSKEQHYERLASFLSANSIDGTSTIIDDNNQKTNNNNEAWISFFNEEV